LRVRFLPGAPFHQNVSTAGIHRPSSFSLGSEAGPYEHPPKIDDLLLVDVVMSRGIERLSLGSQCHSEAAVVLPCDGANAFEERQHVVPLDVVADRMSENLVHRCLMMGVQLAIFCQFSLQTAR
jgi:hypothetical protein